MNSCCWDMEMAAVVGSFFFLEMTLHVAAAAATAWVDLLPLNVGRVVLGAARSLRSVESGVLVLRLLLTGLQNLE